MDDEIDIELRGATEISLRAIIVAAVLQRISLEDVAERSDLDVVGEAFDLREWLLTERLADALTSREARIFETSVGEIPREDCLDLSWQSEALAALLWSIGVQKLHAFGLLPELASLLENVPHPWDRVSGWVEQAQPRPESDIAREREVADLCYWRLGAEIERRLAHTRERTAYEQAIREVVTEAAAAGHPVDAKRGDFVVSERLVRDIGAEELHKLAAMAEERLRALNWVSGFGTSWDDVPLEI
jgi:hypothetical protein